MAILTFQIGHNHPNYAQFFASISDFFTFKSLSSFSDFTLCGDPEQPVSSLVDRKSPTVVDYSCVKGFRLEGSAIRECETAKGTWMGVAPRCKGKLGRLRPLIG